MEGFWNKKDETDQIINLIKDIYNKAENAIKNLCVNYEKELIQKLLYTFLIIYFIENKTKERIPDFKLPLCILVIDLIGLVFDDDNVIGRYCTVNFKKESLIDGFFIHSDDQVSFFKETVLRCLIVKRAVRGLIILLYICK